MVFSIITPSFNQARFLPETIQSVLGQNADLEYIIIDGGSTDPSAEIIRSYENRIKFWESEKDSGQANAINKGFRHATGDIIAWINSDDKYLPDTLKKVENIFGDPRVMWLTGDVQEIDEAGRVTGYYKSELPRDYFHWLNLLVRGFSTSLLQPATFWRRKVMLETGRLNEEMHFSFDHDFFLRIYEKFGPPAVISEPLAQFRMHSESKSVRKNQNFLEENRKMGLAYARKQPLIKKVYLNFVSARQKFRNG